MLSNFSDLAAAGEEYSQSLGHGNDHQFTLMGTIASVTFYGSPEKTAAAADTVQAEFKRIEELCNQCLQSQK